MTTEYHTPLGEGGMLRLNYRGKIVCSAAMIGLGGHTLHAVPPEMGDFHVHEHYEASLSHENTSTAITVMRMGIPVHVVGSGQATDIPVDKVLHL